MTEKYCEQCETTKPISKFYHHGSRANVNCASCDNDKRHGRLTPKEIKRTKQLDACLRNMPRMTL